MTVPAVVILPLLSTVKTGIEVCVPYVPATTPVLVKDMVAAEPSTLGVPVIDISPTEPLKR